MEFDLVLRESCVDTSPPQFIYRSTETRDVGRRTQWYFYSIIYNKLSLITKTNYWYNIAYTNTPHADGYKLMLEYKEIWL